MLNESAYADMWISDLNKTLMFAFYYNYINDRYSKKAKLLLTDKTVQRMNVQITDKLCVWRFF